MILSDCRKCASDLGYPTHEIENIDNQYFHVFCDNVLISLKSLQFDQISPKEAFAAIETSLSENTQKEQTSAKFICTLAKHMALPLSERIELKDIPLFARKMDMAIRNSKLTESDVSDCRKFLQTVVCSYVFWAVNDTQN